PAGCRIGVNPESEVLAQAVGSAEDPVDAVRVGDGVGRHADPHIDAAMVGVQHPPRVSQDDQVLALHEAVRAAPNGDGTAVMTVDVCRLRGHVDVGTETGWVALAVARLIKAEPRSHKAM